MLIMCWLIHGAGLDYGGRYCVFQPYDFWSGIAGSFLIGLAVWLIGRWTRSCHVWWCPRRAMFDYEDPRSGLTYRLCRKCHPDHSGKIPTRKRLYLGRQPGPG
jgi:hypothetical protein